MKATSGGYRWTEVSKEAVFAPRDGAGALVFENRMWLLGGWNPQDRAHFPRKCNSEIWASCDGVSWDLVNKSAPWEGRHTAGYVVHAGRMWIVGGDIIQGHYQNDVWSSVDGVVWELICTEVPWKSRVLHYTVVHAGKIWVMGGQTLPPFVDGEEVFYADIWNSTDGVKWEKVADRLPWGPRGMIGGHAIFQGRIWIMGGGTYNTPARPDRIFYNDVWSSADGIDWVCHTEKAPWCKRQYHEIAVFDSHLWILEGYAGGTSEDKWANLKDVWYSRNGTDWTEVPDSPWPARHAASVFAYEDALWLVAGNNMTSDVWKLTRS